MQKENDLNNFQEKISPDLRGPLPTGWLGRRCLSLPLSGQLLGFLSFWSSSQTWYFVKPSKQASRQLWNMTCGRCYVVNPDVNINSPCSGLTFLVCRRLRRCKKFESRKERLVLRFEARSCRYASETWSLFGGFVIIGPIFSAKIRGQLLTSTNGGGRPRTGAG